jgi:hypothetical protein
MATENCLESITLVAAADLSGSQFRVATVNASGLAARAVATDVAMGIIQNKPAAGQAATVGYRGVSKAVYGGNVTAGARVTSDANGLVITAGVGDSALGLALVSGVANDIGSVLIGAAGVGPAAALS